MVRYCFRDVCIKGKINIKVHVKEIGHADEQWIVWFRTRFDGWLL
jgi:hypothetical protein